MRYKKTYGLSKISKCPFCDRPSTAKNSQALPVCQHHKTAMLGEMKCACGSWLLLQEGKHGTYFNCMDCGNRSLEKIFAINDVKDVSDNPDYQEKDEEPVEFSKKKRKIEREEITITSDDPNFF